MGIRGQGSVDQSELSRTINDWELSIDHSQLLFEPLAAEWGVDIYDESTSGVRWYLLRSPQLAHHTAWYFHSRKP